MGERAQVQRKKHVAQPQTLTPVAAPADVRAPTAPVAQAAAPALSAPVSQKETAALEQSATQSEASFGHSFDTLLLTGSVPPPDPRPAVAIQRQRDISVQRDGQFQLTPPSLVQPPDPASRYHLGGELQLHLDPELEAMMQQQLHPDVVLPSLAQINLNVPAASAATPPPDAGSSATTAPTPAAPPSAAAPPASPTPPNADPKDDKPKNASAGDVVKAVVALPQVKIAWENLQTLTMAQVKMDWSKLKTGEKVGVISTVAVIGLGGIAGLSTDPAARQLVFDQINGKTIPVPGLSWLAVETNIAGPNLMFGLHLDIGRFMPSVLNFGPSDPNAIGGPPQPEPLPGQRRAADDATPSNDASIGARIRASAGRGAALEVPMQQWLEGGLGADLSPVRLHTDSEADHLSRSLGATAFTTGPDIFFRSGAYSPGTSDGQRLLAHEATHTVQQATGPVAGTPTASGVAVSDPADSYERAAERTADALVQRMPASPLQTKLVGPIFGTSPEKSQLQPLQRQTFVTPGMILQRKDDQNDKQAGAALHTRATAVSNKFRSGHTDVNSAVTDALTTADKARNTYLAYATKYDSAYTKVQGVLTLAKEQLELQDKATDTIIGIAIGVGIGLGVGAFVEAVGVTTLAAKLAWEAIGESMEAAAAWGVGKTQADKRDTGSKALTDPPSTTPTAVKLEIWQKLAEAYRSAAVMSTNTGALADAMHWADVVSGEALVHKSGGQGERSLEDVEKAVTALEQIAVRQDPLQAAIGKLRTSMTRLEGAAGQAGVPNEQKLEQQIWIEWMANLSEDASNRLLDNDAIEDHLREVGVLTGNGKDGALKTDFKGWTTKDDTDAAVDEAKSVRSDTYRDTFGPQQVGKVAKVSVIVGGGSSVSSYMVDIPGTRWSWPVDVSTPLDANESRQIELGNGVQITAYNAATKRLTGFGPV